MQRKKTMMNSGVDAKTEAKLLGLDRKDSIESEESEKETTELDPKQKADR